MLKSGRHQSQGGYDYRWRVTAMRGFLKRLLGFISSPSHQQGNKSVEEFAGKTCHPNHRLNSVEIQFLTLLEGKRANDPSVLGWWCAFNNIDGPKTINKLCTSNYLTVADYKFTVRKGTIPVLKAFLTKHGLSTRGKKDDLVNRIIENICESKCLEHFTQSYWAFTPKALALLHAQEIKAQEEYRRIVDLIRKGSYDALKNKLYPNKNEHWGTEDTFCETIDFLMKHGFEGFGLSEEIQRNVSSFVAARAVDYSSRGYSTCTQDISNYLRTEKLGFEALKLPDSLMKCAKENDIGSQDDIYNIYIQFIIDRARAIAELNEYRRLGIKKIRVDALACRECERSTADKVYNINKAPLLPHNWNCQCIYESVL